MSLWWWYRFGNWYVIKYLPTHLEYLGVQMRSRLCGRGRGWVGLHWPRSPPSLSFLLCRPLERMQAPTCYPRKFPSLVCTLGLEGHCFLMWRLPEFIFSCLIYLLTSKLIFWLMLGLSACFCSKLSYHIQYFENQINSSPPKNSLSFFLWLHCAACGS